MVILIDVCNTATGNAFDSIDVKNNRKSGLILDVESADPSFTIIASSEGIQLVHRWQFYNKTQSPYSFPRSISLSVTGPCPYPNDLTTNLSLAPFSAAKLHMIYAGSVPGDKMNTIGVA